MTSGSEEKVSTKNFRIQVAGKSLTKLGDELINPKTVLAWVVISVGAPVWVISWLVPVRDSLSMLPQLYIARASKKWTYRKHFWMIGAFLQALAVAALAVVAWNLRGVLAGYVLLGALAVFSLARSIDSVTGKEILGKTIPKKRRGRLNGTAAWLAGLAGLAVAIYLISVSETEKSPIFFAVFFIAASVCWLISCLVYFFLDEEPSSDMPEKGSALGQLSLIKQDPELGWFIVARTFFLGTALMLPFLVAYAREHTGSDFTTFAGVFLAHGLSESLSALAWGRLSDRSSRKVMAAGADLVALTAAIVLVTPTNGLAQSPWFYAGAYLFASIGYNGVRLGRKTYIVDLASDENRGPYVAVSNTVIAILLLAAGAISTALQTLGLDFVIAAFALSCLLGIAVTMLKLKEVE